MRAAYLATVAILTAMPSAQAASWYVNNAVSGGAASGTSWANAWTSMRTVVWANLRGGDTLYISGGSSSRTYAESWTVGKGGASGAPITISTGQEAGHNGTVIFDYNSLGDNASATGITLGQSHVVLTGNVGGANRMQLNNLRNIITRTSAVGIYGSANTGVVIDHITFINNNNPIRMSGANGVSIQYCSFQQVRGDAAINIDSNGQFDANLIHDNYIETMFNQALPPGGSGLYYGPDGIQGGSGLSIYNNIFKEITTTVYTSNQHPDMLQITGNYVKVYGNEFINEGDAVFDYDCYANARPHDVWVYNNLFHVVTTLDPYPEFFRLYSSAGAIQSINNFKIMNNVIVDAPGYRVVRMDTFNGNPTGTGNEIKNNIFYNTGSGSSQPNLYIAESSGFTSSSFAIDGNIYYNSSGTSYVYFRGSTVTAASWIGSSEPHGKMSSPAFVSYSPRSASNDFHLRPTDSVARDNGVALSSYFTTDKDGVARPQGSGWDIGAFEVGGTQTSNACDLTKDGVVNSSDIELALDMTLGVKPCDSTVMGAGVCNVVVVQRVVNASLGGACRVQ